MAEEIDGLVDVPPDLSSPGELVVRDRVDERVRVVVSTAVTSLRQQQLLAEAGVSGADFIAASQLPAVSPLDPQSAEDESLLLFANAGIILMFIAIFSYGTWVLTAVVEEKQSRVVEVVLSTVRPRDLLMGKVLGIGTLALGQLLVLVLVGIAAARITRRPRPARDDPGHRRDVRALVRAGVPALRDDARVPRLARDADGGGVERDDAGHDARDHLLLRDDLRRPGATRAGRSRPC